MVLPEDIADWTTVLTSAQIAEQIISTSLQRVRFFLFQTHVQERNAPTLWGIN